MGYLLTREAVMAGVSHRTFTNDAAIIKQYAFILHSAGQQQRAIELLRGVLGDHSVPEAALVLAGMLFDEGKLDEAKQVLESAPIDGFDPELKAEMRRLLEHVHLRKSDFEGARNISAALRSEDPANLLNLVDAARIERRAGNIDAASRLLEEACGYVTDQTPPRQIIDLADELYALEKYPDAWPLYQRITDARVDSYLVRNLLYSYYRAGETAKAMEFSKCIPPAHKTQHLLQIELSVLEDVGNLTSAAEAAESYIQAHPEDVQTRIHLATIWFRTDQLEKLDAFIDEGVDVSQLPLAAGFQLAGLCGERDRARKALEIAYELRRKYPQNGEAHLKYIGIFLGGERRFGELLESSKTVQPDMAVRTTNDMGQDLWHILEERYDVNVLAGELAVSSELGKRVLGKAVGDDVVTAEGSIEKVTVKVAEIKSKYVHAFQESMRLLPERFGNTKGIERVTFKSGSEEETQESIQKILGVVEKRNEWVLQAEKFYHESKLTVGAFAQLIDRNVIDVWNGLVGSKWGVKSCLGSLEERQTAFDLLADQQTVVLDITSLLTAERLKILPVLENRFHKILVAQSTVDLLTEAISERKGKSSDGYMTIGKNEGAFVREEVPAEIIKSQIDYLERLKKWVREHCDVTPLKKGSIPKSENERREMLGPCFLDTMAIAKEQGSLLYTDDFGTNMLARNDFGVESFWTQVLLMAALTDKQISEEEYNEAALQLIHLKYRHTTISAQIILHAAKKTNWSITDQFVEVLETLRGTQMEIQSVVAVLVEFMFQIWQQPVSDFQRDNIVMTALDVLSDQRDDRAVARLVRVAVQIRFKLVPLTETRVQQVISAWEILRRRPGIIHP
jgi:tetratricopeptide (TPR) repeat protein